MLILKVTNNCAPILLIIELQLCSEKVVHEIEGCPVYWSSTTDSMPLVNISQHKIIVCVILTISFLYRMECVCSSFLKWTHNLIPQCCFCIYSVCSLVGVIHCVFFWWAVTAMSDTVSHDSPVVSVHIIYCVTIFIL